MKKWNRWQKFAAFTLAGMIVLTVCGYAAMIITGLCLFDPNKLTMSQKTEVFDHDNEKIADLFHQNRQLVKLDDVPKNVRNAFIAVEDKRFYRHLGVDWIGVFRALVKDLSTGRLVQGGSTITQQLVKETFLNADKTFTRKWKEASLATILEMRYSKAEILEMYLNRIYFGHRVYGIESASQLFFGKDVGELTLGEAAVLAAIPKAPANYSPYIDLQAAKERRNLVLSLMADQHMITKEQEEAAKREPIQLAGIDQNDGDDHFYDAYLDLVYKEAKEKYGLTEQDLMQGGYRIYTNVDSQMQKTAVEAFADPRWFPDDMNGEQVEGGMTLMNAKTGEVLAVVGGRDYQAKGLNHALTRRQPGSAFKPIAVYAPALEMGYHPYDVLPDKPMKFGNYEPKNYDGRYRGEVLMYDALRQSYNIPAVWLLNRIGADKGVAFAKKLGIQLNPKDKYLSIALGGLTDGVSTLEMAQAYTPFGQAGVWHGAYTIREIRDLKGRLIARAKPQSKQAMSAQSAWYLTKMLEAVVRNGTGSKADFGRPVAGKTGTTQVDFKGISGNRDAWFVGYTPELCAAIWMGFDRTDEKHYLSDSGGGAPARLFGEIMGEILKGQKTLDFVQPDGVEDLAPPLRLKKVEGLNGEYRSDDNEIVLNWQPLNGPAGYRIYRLDPSNLQKYVLQGETTDSSWVDKDVEEGTLYGYRVVAFDPRTGRTADPSDPIQVITADEGMFDWLFNNGNDHDKENKGKGPDKKEKRNGKKGNGETDQEGGAQPPDYSDSAPDPGSDLGTDWPLREAPLDGNQN
jgi:penicillin-binding protein 2A